MFPTDPPNTGISETPANEPMRPIQPLPPLFPEAPKVPQPKSRRSWLFIGLALGAVGAVALLAALWSGGVFDSNGEEPVTAAPTAVTTTVPQPAPTTLAPAITVPATPPQPVDPSLLTISDASDVGAIVVPSVVTVEVGRSNGAGFTPVASGSGVVLDAAGYIVTNDHVVSAGTAYEVVLADGRVYDAVLLGTDPETDLAVLQVEATDLVPIQLGATDPILVGDPAIAVGSPLGLEGGPSLTVGVVSAFGREVRTSAVTTLYGMVQTDAPITQGSSGGALVDGQGRLIGITTAVGVSDVGIEGIGFATPIEIVTRVTNEIIANGEASQPFLGISGGTAFEDISDSGRRPIGVAVGSVENESAAAAGGVVTDDVITALDGQAIDTMDELIALLRRYSAGTEVELTVVRDGATTILSVELGNG